MSGDAERLHSIDEVVIRLEAWMTGRNANVHPAISTTLVTSEPRGRTEAAYTLAESDLRAALDEIQQLQAKNADLRDIEADRVREVRAAFAAGWSERGVITAQRLGTSTDERETAGHAYTASRIAEWHTAAASQQPEPEPALTDRQTKLLSAVRCEGGDWAPIRARDALVEAGYDMITKSRAHQIMKQLAEHGYLEQVRPRAYTYRLAAPQRPAHDGQTCPCGCPVDNTCRCSGVDQCPCSPECGFCDAPVPGTQGSTTAQDKEAL